MGIFEEIMNTPIPESLDCVLDTLTREEALWLLNSGCGKGVDAVWEESINDAITHLPKPIQTDSGGTDGSVPEAYIDVVRKLRQCETDVEAAEMLYTRDDGRNKALRLAMVPRRAMIRAKLYRTDAIGKQEYYCYLVEMTKQTLSEGNKTFIRRRLANREILERIRDRREEKAKKRG